MAQDIIRIERQSGFAPIDWEQLWGFRQLLGFLAWRDIKVRYKQTALGAAWAILQPLMNMIIFTLLFNRLAKMPSDNVPYPLFVLAGLLPWTFFANSVSTASNSLIGNSHLITRVYFPRLIIPLSSILAGVLDFAVTFVLMFAMMAYYHVGPSTQMLLLPALVAVTMLAALGVGTGISAITVAYRDFRYVVPFAIQVWMFLSPVVYPLHAVPERWRWLLFLNPMAGIIDAYRSALFNAPFHWSNLGISFVTATLIFLLGVFYFRRVERGFADII